LSHKRAYHRWVKKGRPAPACRLAKAEVIEAYRKQTGSRTLIETGTYLGDMVFVNLKKFSKICSIELDKHLFLYAQRRFKRFSNVRILQGDSGTILWEVLKEVNEPAIFWLDGHYSGGITAQGDKLCPIFDELEAILSYDQHHVLFIDDARLFRGTGGYPQLSELRSFIEQKKPGSEIRIEDDIIQIHLR